MVTIGIVCTAAFISSNRPSECTSCNLDNQSLRSRFSAYLSAPLSFCHTWGFLPNFWATEHSCYVLHASPICSFSIAQSQALVVLFSYWFPVTEMVQWTTAGLISAFYLFGIPLQTADQGCELLLGSFQGLRHGQLAILLSHLFHCTFLHLWLLAPEREG